MPCAFEEVRRGKAGGMRYIAAATACFSTSVCVGLEKRLGEGGEGRGREEGGRTVGDLRGYGYRGTRSTR